MPRVTVTGFIDNTTPNFGFLQKQRHAQVLVFSGSTLPTTLQVGQYDEENNFVPFDGGTVTALPSSFVVNAAPESGIIINVDGGSPDFIITSGGRIQTS